MPNFSGARWWHANQQRYPNSRRLDDLDGDFRDNVRRFLQALQDGGAMVNVTSTRRNGTRAHLMHYSWRVANGEIAPHSVPQVAGLDIEWNHGDLESSRRAAREMVNLFGMAHIASLTSNHIRGQAVDMTITWRGELTIEVPGRELPETIRTGPRNGAANRELHRIGREFGVRKLLNDPPHWSVDGR